MNGNDLNRCLFCPCSERLTDEHVFPAALGCEDVVPSASCGVCNGTFSEEFEAKFNKLLKPVCYLLRIGNRQGKVPSIDAVTVVDGREFKLVLRPDRTFQLRNKVEHRVLESGERVTDYFIFSKEDKENLRERARKRNERLERVENDGKPIQFEPESFMRLDFVNQPVALRSATKAAVMALAKVAGHRFASLDAFQHARAYALQGAGAAARLFVNKNFAANSHFGPHQHVVQVYCNGKQGNVYAIVVFFGGLSYLVELSTRYYGPDYGFSYAYDAFARKQTVVLTGQLETERLATEDVRNGETKFDDVLCMAEHWATYIRSVAAEEIKPIE